MYIGEAVTIILISLNSIQDIRKKEIYLLPTIAALVLGIFFKTSGLLDSSEFFSAYIPGLLMILISVMCKGQIGMGDGILVLALGSWNSLDSMVFIICLGLIIAAAAAGIMWIRGKRKCEMPFVPCLIAPAVINLLLLCL